MPAGEFDEDEMAIRRTELVKLKEYLTLFPQKWAISERPLNKRKKMVNVVLDVPSPAGRDPLQVSRHVSPEFARMMVLMRKLMPDLIELAEREMDGRDEDK